MRDRAPLSGRAALVTGGARGIGRAYALRLAKLGADVAVMDLDLGGLGAEESDEPTDDGIATHKAIAQLGRNGVGFEVDVTDERGLADAVAGAVTELGGLDIVVCNAGGGSGSMTDSLASRADERHVDEVLRRNLVGTISTCRITVPYLRGQGWGRIVTVSSLAGHTPFRDGGYAIYGAAKAGIATYTRSLAQELGPERITVNCLAPGYIATRRLQAMFDTLGVEDLQGSVALRRLGTPEDCAGVLEFLVTDLGAYVTGAVIPVDGGVTV